METCGGMGIVERDFLPLGILKILRGRLLGKWSCEKFEVNDQ